MQDFQIKLVENFRRRSRTPIILLYIIVIKYLCLRVRLLNIIKPQVFCTDICRVHHIYWQLHHCNWEMPNVFPTYLFLVELTVAYSNKKKLLIRIVGLQLKWMTKHITLCV